MEFTLKKPNFGCEGNQFASKKPNIGEKRGSEFTMKKPNISDKNVGKGAMSFLSTWETFQNFTTSHGISHFRHAKGCFKKSLWLFSTIGCLAALCYNIYLISLKYVSYDVNVKVNLKHANLLQFPAVTICNNNPMKRSSLNRDLQGVISTYKNELNSFPCDNEFKNFYGGDQPENPGNDPGAQTVPNDAGDSFLTHSESNSSGSTTGHNVSPCFPTSGYTEDGREQRSDYRLMTQMLEKYIALNHSDRMEKGHLLQEMVYDCVFSGSGCKMERDFTYFFNNYHGNCYTYNSAMNGFDENNAKVSFKAGPRYGLSIIFDVNQREYIGELSQSAGLRVVVHDPRRMPFPEDEAILVSPTYLTHIGVTMIKTSKLNGKYGDCRGESDRDLPKTIYEEIYNLSYCEKGCHYSCINDEIIKKCSCVDIKFPMKRSNRSTLQPCSIDDETNDLCAQSVWRAYKSETLPCISNCTVPCRQTTYKPIVSRERWPSVNYRANIKNVAYYKALTADFEKFQEGSFGKVVVYLQDLTYTEISEAPFYELHEFTSDIGGVLGLYVGFSILTLVEFLELFIDLAGIFFYRLFHSCPSSSSSSSSSYRKDKVGKSSENRIFQNVSTIEVVKSQRPLLGRRASSYEKFKKQSTESFSLDEADQDSKKEEVNVNDNLKH